ncbi:hypothetical protein BGZ97_006990, partial [Linnemannia gamsii]
EADGETVTFFRIHKQIRIDKGVVVMILTPSLEVLGFQFREERWGVPSSEKFDLLGPIHLPTLTALRMTLCFVPGLYAIVRIDRGIRQILTVAEHPPYALLGGRLSIPSSLA